MFLIYFKRPYHFIQSRHRCIFIPEIGAEHLSASAVSAQDVNFQFKLNENLPNVIGHFISRMLSFFKVCQNTACGEA